MHLDKASLRRTTSTLESVGLILLLLLSNILLFVPSSAEAGPGDLGESWFYDGFEKNLSAWTVTGDVRLETDLVYAGAQAAGLTPGSSINRSLGIESQEVVVEAWFYDYGPDTKNTVSAFVYAANASNEVRVGVDTALSQWQYFADFGEKPMLLDAKRTEGWHMLRLHLIENVSVIAIDKIEIAKFPLSKPTGYGVESKLGNFFIDEFSVWWLYRDNVWKGVPTQIIPKGYDKWNEGAIWDSKTLYNKADGSFTMWFLASDGLGQNSLGYATSVDGYSWVYAGLVPPLVFKFVPLGMDIMLYSEMYYLYVSDGSSVWWFESSKPTTDWTEMGAVLTKGNPGDMDSGQINSLSVVADPGGAYFMMYSAWSEKMDYPRLFLAKAPDGVHWEKAQRDPIFDLGQLTDGPDIQVIDGLYYAWFHTSSWNQTINSNQYSVYCIMSKDLFTWEKAPQYAQLMAATPEKGDYKTFGNMYPNPVNSSHGSYIYFTYDVNGARSIYMQSSDYHIMDVAEGNVVQYGTVYLQEPVCTVQLDGTIQYAKADPLASTMLKDFTVTPGSAPVTVKLETWNTHISPTSSDVVARINASSTVHDNIVTFRLWLPIYIRYEVFVDGILSETKYPNTDNNFTFTHTSWSNTLFTVRGVALSGNTKTWDAAGAGSVASNANAWLPIGVPGTGDNIVFDGTSTKPCTSWDISGDYGIITITAAYVAPQGSITWTNKVLCAGYSTTGNHAEVVNGQRMTSSGNVTIGTGQTWTGASWNLTLTGGYNFKTLTSHSAYTFTHVTFGGSGYIAGTLSTSIFQVNSTKYANITNGGVLYMTPTSTTTLRIYGTVQSTGTGVFDIVGTAATSYLRLMTGGNNSATTHIITPLGSGADRTFTMLSDFSAGDLRIYSNQNPRLSILEMGSYNLRVFGNLLLTDASGHLYGNTGKVTLYGNWDSSVGTWHNQSSTVEMKGVGKTITVTTGYEFNTLIVKSGARIINFNILHSAKNLTVESSSKLLMTGRTILTNRLNISGTVNMPNLRINVTSAISSPFQGNGTWNGKIYIDGAGTKYHFWIQAKTNWTVYHKVNATWHTQYGLLNVTPPAGVYADTNITKALQTAEAPVIAYTVFITSITTGTASFQFKVSPAFICSFYNNAVQVGSSKTSSASGYVSFQFSGTWSPHNFTVTASGTPAFTSSPVTQAYEDKYYQYTPTVDKTGVTWGMTTNGSAWLSQYAANGTVYGTPSNLYAGRYYWVNISATKGANTGYQNYTASVQNKKPLFTTTPGAGVWITKKFWYNASVDDGSPYGGTFGVTITTNWTKPYNWTAATGKLNFSASVKGSFWFNITFNDNSHTGNATTYQNFTVAVAKPYFTSSPVTQAYEDKAYSYQAVVNTTVTSWSRTSNGSAWISISGTGLVTGTPTNLYAGRYYWVNISAVTQKDGTVYQNYTVSVQNKKPLFTSSPTTTVWKSKPYSYDAEVDDQSPYGGTFGATIGTNYTGSYTYTQATGVLSFTVTKSGYFWFNMTFNDNSHTANATTYQNWTVYVWTPYFTSSPITQGYEDKAYSYTPIVNTTVTTWGWTTNGSAWLSQNPSTGQIYGTPTNLYAGRYYWVNISAATTNDGTIYQNYTVSVQNKKPVFTSTASNNVWWSKPYSYSATVDDWTPYGGTFNGAITTNYTASYTWTSGTGSLSFTASLHGSYWFNITFNDNSHTGNATTYQNFTVYVATPYYTTTAITGAWEDHAYSYTPAVNTTVSIWGYATDGAWINQNPSTGEIYGTPTNTYSMQSFYVHISAATLYDGTVWQNYSVFVANNRTYFTTTPITGVFFEHTYDYYASFEDWATGGSITGLTTNFTSTYSWSTVTGHLQLTAVPVGSYWFNITLNDNSGAGNATRFQNWTLHIVYAVVFTSPPETGAWEDHTYSYYVTTNRSATWTVQTNASWSTWNVVTHHLDGTPDNYNANRWYWINVTVTTPNGRNWQNFTVTVANDITLFTTSPDSEVYQADYYYYNTSFDDWSYGGVFTGMTTNLNSTYTWSNATGKLQFYAVWEGYWWFNITIDDMSGAANATIYQNFTVHIKKINLITSSPVTYAYEDNLYQYQLVANKNPCIWTMTTDSNFTSIGVLTGLIQGTPNNWNSVHSYWINVTCQYGSFIDNQNYTFFVVNRAPVIDPLMPSEFTVFWLDDVNFTATFDDIFEGGEWTYFDTNYTGVIGYLNLHTGMMEFIATDIGTFWFSGLADDNTGASNNTALYNLTLHIIYALHFTSSPVTSNVEDHAYAYQVTANTTATFTFTSNATWLTMNATGFFDGTPSNLYAHKSFWVNITGTNVNGYYWQNFTISTVNVKPSFTTTPGTTVYREKTFYFNASFDDFVDGGVFVTITTNFTGSYSFNTANGKLQFSYAAVGQFWFNITANDLSGAVNATAFQNFTVDVIWAFVFTSSPVTGAWEDHLYAYFVTTNVSIDTWSVITTAFFLSISSGGYLHGVPDNRYAERTFLVNITATNENGTNWQEFYLFVANYQPAFTTTPAASFSAKLWYAYNSATSDSMWGGTFPSYTTNLVDGMFQFNMTTGVFKLYSNVEGTFWFNMTYDDGTGVANSTCFQNWIMTFKLGTPGGGVPSNPFIADFTWSVTNGTGKVTFTDKSLGTNILEWSWSFGDGSTSTKQNPSHQYKKVGTYTVTLTIKDAVGRTASVTKQVTIVEVGQASLIPSSMMTIVPMVIIVLGLLGAVGGRTQPGRIASIVVILVGLLLFLMGYV